MNLSVELEKTSNAELHARTLQAAKKDQQSTLDLLIYLHEVERRKLFAEKGFASLWDYVQKALGYSESQTGERINAMRFMFRAREARSALESGKLNVTQAAMTERCLKNEEKETKEKVSKEVVQSLLSQVEGKSKRDTEKVLLSYQPKPEVRKERVQQITEEFSELRFQVSEEVRQQMERYWEFKGKTSVAELFATCLAFYIQSKDPQPKDLLISFSESTQEPKDQVVPNLHFTGNVDRKSDKTFPGAGGPGNVSPTVVKKPSRYIPKAVRIEVRNRAKGCCEYVDSESGKRCGSKYLLQFDHIHPFSWGGDSDTSNLRLLCAAHNQYLGKEMLRKGPLELFGNL